MIQTVTVSADPPAGPFVTPASSAATARVAPSARSASGAISARLQVCILPKQASCDPTKDAEDLKCELVVLTRRRANRG